MGPACMHLLLIIVAKQMWAGPWQSFLVFDEPETSSINGNHDWITLWHIVFPTCDKGSLCTTSCCPHGLVEDQWVFLSLKTVLRALPCLCSGRYERRVKWEGGQFHLVLSVKSPWDVHVQSSKDANRGWAIFIEHTEIGHSIPRPKFSQLDRAHRCNRVWLASSISPKFIAGNSLSFPSLSSSQGDPWGVVVGPLKLVFSCHVSKAYQNHMHSEHSERFSVARKLDVARCEFMHFHATNITAVMMEVVRCWNTAKHPVPACPVIDQATDTVWR